MARDTQNVIALKLHGGKVKVEDEEVQMKLPAGCVGLLFCFQDKHSAKKYWGEDISVVGYELESSKKSKVKLLRNIDV